MVSVKMANNSRQIRNGNGNGNGSSGSPGNPVTDQ